MEEDFDIYMDLPNIHLAESDINDQPKAEHACNCEELEQKYNSVTSELENIKQKNKNLDKNFASLLKTAKVEIARKDKMIEELRNQLDNAAFKRNNNGSQRFPNLRSSHQRNTHTMIEKYEKSVTSSINSEEDSFMSQQVESYYPEYKSKKPQNNIDQVPVTVFGERLQKRIIDAQREERKLKTTSSKLSSETNMDNIPEECIIESDKENGSQSGINNSANESNAITRSSNSGTLYKKNSGKRPNEEDDTYKSKRLKTEDNEDGNDDDNIDYNSVRQYEPKDLTQLEGQLCVMPSLKKDHVPLETKRRASSEYRDTKQARCCKNGWKKEESSSTKDYDDARTNKGSVDSSRNHWAASTSNERLDSDHHHDIYINGYRRNDYRHGSSSSRSYSKSRSDYGSSNSHRLREKSSRTYRDRKYDDYRYVSRHKNDWPRRGYDSKETDGVRTRYGSKDRGDLRDRLRHTTSDIEDRERRSGSYKSKKYDNRRPQETTATVSEDKRSHKGSKAMIEIDSRTSSSQTVVNTTVDHGVEKNAEQHSTKNEPCASASSVENASTCVTANDRTNLEEGEIIDSPKKKLDFTKLSANQVMEENVAKNIQVEDTSNNVPVGDQTVHIKSRDFNQILQDTVTITVTTKQLEEMAGTSTGETEAATSLLLGIAEDKVREETTQLNPAGELVTMTDSLHNDSDMSSKKSKYTYFVLDSLTSEAMCSNNNYVGDCINCLDENSRDDTNDSFVRLEEMYDFYNGDAGTSGERNNDNAEGTTEVDKGDNPGTDNDIRQTDCEDAKNSAANDTTQVETVPNCDSVDRGQVSTGNETSRQILDNSNAEASRACLGDHNYVRDAVIEASNLDAIPNVSECRESALDTATSKDTEAEKTTNIQSVDTKKTSLTVKNKKDQNSKSVVISRRRKAVTLSDSNASMTVLINRDSTRLSLVDNSASDKSDSVSKPRACKLARTVKPPCK